MEKRTKPSVTLLGKIFNNFTCCCCFITLVSLYLQFTPILAADAEQTEGLNVTSTAETNATFLTPVAEALVRYRRHPLTIVKHIIRPKRTKIKRVKRPKIKYSFAEPPPHIYYKNRSKPPVIKPAPIFDSSIFDDFAHINIKSVDFDAPPSSYEAQSMDLDLYSSYETPAEGLYKSSHKSKHPYTEPELTFEEHADFPTYSFAAPKKVIREPHTKYGVPTDFGYSTDFVQPSDNSHTSSGKTVESPTYLPSSFDFDQPGVNSYKSHEFSKTSENSHYNAPSYKPSTIVEKPQYHAPAETPTFFRPEEDEHSYIKAAETPRIPATTYGVPDMPIPAKNFDNYNKYSIVEHQPSSYESYESIKSNQHHFAEPPDQEQNVEIMYSPSYEINIQPPKDEEHHSGYETHPQQQYESPSNHHVPSSPYQESADTHQPPSYEPAPPQDLPINHNHKHPTYDYPKSSYEVPIYDPIPFESSHNQEQEIYPPTYDESSWKDASPEYVAEPNNVSEQKPNDQINSQHADSGERPSGDTYSSGTRPTSDVIPPRLQRTRNRKRNKGSTLPASTIHILDVPELQQAFENEKRQQQLSTKADFKDNPSQPHTTIDSDFNESNKVPNTNNGRWNPMKLRTPPIIASTLSPTTAHTHHHYKSNYNRSHRPRATTTTQAPSIAPTAPSKVQIISIDKSRSKSYYDGILSTPKIYNPHFYRSRYKSQQVSTTTSTTTSAPQPNRDRFSKRTTKNIFDTTMFKSPLNDKDVYRNLPKNHKLF